MFDMIVLLIARSFRANLVSIPIPEKFNLGISSLLFSRLSGKRQKTISIFLPRCLILMQQESIHIFCHLIHMYHLTCLLHGRLLDLVAALVAMFNFVPAAPFGHQECICPKCVRARYMSSCIPVGGIITPSLTQPPWTCTWTTRTSWKLVSRKTSESELVDDWRQYTRLCRRRKQ
jgi:hypothetical protein